MNILGINSFFEHPSVSLLMNNEIAFAMEEERLTGIKHGKKYTPYKTYVPYQSIFAALNTCGLTMRDIDEIAYSYDSRAHLKGLFGCITGSRISSLREEVMAYLACRNVRYALSGDYELPLYFQNVILPKVARNIPYHEWEHHKCHAASAYYCSSFESSLIIVADGSGEVDSTSIFVGKNENIDRIDHIPIPHSLGIFYSMVTKHLGFEPFSDEYKVMALASYGSPRFMNEMNNILMIGAGPHYRINLQRLMNLTPLLGEPRQPNSDLSEKHFDIAASLQCQLETAIEKIIVYYARTTGLRNICLAGGTFLNVVANAKIAATGCFDDVFIQPASHDAGTSLGAAMLSSRRRDGPCRFPMSSVALGTFYSSAQIERTLQQSGVMYQKLEDADLIDFLALMLAEKRVCGLFRGRIEFGPRALGMRSLLANPMDEKMLEHINSLKGREQFRPLAPMVTEESFSKYFEGVQNRYMLFTVDVRDEMRTVIPAVTHIDGSSRTQVVREREDPFMHKLLNRFADHTGVPVLINTSLNIRGKPIVEHPTDALALLYTSGLDVLALENFVVLGVK